MTAATTSSDDFGARSARSIAVPGRSVVRALALLALAAQVLFTVAWLIAGALEPGYSHVEQTVSELGARDAATPAIANAGLVVLGLGIAALGPGVARVLPRGRAATVAAVALVVAGLGLAANGFVTLECQGIGDPACTRAWQDGRLDAATYAHGWIGLVARLAFLVTPFAIAAALWARPAAALALGAGITGVAVAVASVAFWYGGGAGDDGLGGLVERFELLLLHLWAVAVAAGVLYETRPAPRLPAPTPVPPRDFFGRAWRGDGEVVLWPPLVWRHLPLRFRASRTATWLTEDTWTFDDEAVFPGGYRQARRRFCQFVGPDRIHVSADDQPGGAEVLLGGDGYRIAPFTLLIPVGPLRLPLRCREHGRLEGRTLVDTVELRFLGLPAGRVTMRVAPVE